MMTPVLFSRLLAASLAFWLGGHAAAADAARTVHYFDEIGMRHLTVAEDGSSRIKVTIRWTMDPGSAGGWAGQGSRRDDQIVFAAMVEEGQDRGAYFVAKGGESKLEISFRPNQKMPQDPGILGVYRHISDEKRLQLLRKESQAADDRLIATLKDASRSWPSGDKPVAADWKSRWPLLRERWMKIAYQPPEPPKPKPGTFLPSAAKEGALPEKDAEYWLKLAQTTAMAYSFMQQAPDPNSKGGWDGEYDDGFGGHVGVRLAKDGRLRVTLTCTRLNELQGMDLSGTISADAVKSKGSESTAEGVFTEGDGTGTPKQVNVSLRRRGGFLWVEARFNQPSSRKAWLDGIYRWSPAPVE